MFTLAACHSGSRAVESNPVTLLIPALLDVAAGVALCILGGGSAVHSITSSHPGQRALRGVFSGVGIPWTVVGVFCAMGATAGG